MPRVRQSTRWDAQGNELPAPRPMTLAEVEDSAAQARAARDDVVAQLREQAPLLRVAEEELARTPQLRLFEMDEALRAATERVQALLREQAQLFARRKSAERRLALLEQEHYRASRASP